MNSREFMNCRLSTLDVILNQQPEEWDIMNSRASKEEMLTRWFFPEDDMLFERMQQLELSDWLSNSTLQVSVQFMTYNANFDLLSLTGIHFFFSHSGHIWKKVVHSTLELRMHRELRGPIYLIFLLNIVYLLCKTLMNMNMERKRW